jgi:hypothetical protein
VSGERSHLRRRAAALLDQQLWCWGRDVARPEGNVLLELGMCRYRTAEPGRERSAYTGRVRGDGVVWLWGFGAYFWLPGLGGAFFRRKGFEPLLRAAPLEAPVHAVAHLVGLRRPATSGERTRAAKLVRATCEWVAEYEHWIAEALGTEYRAAALAARDRAPSVTAREMPRAWEHLAKKAHRLCAGAPTPRGPWRAAPFVPTAPAVPPRAGRAAPTTRNRFPLA